MTDIFSDVDGEVAFFGSRKTSSGKMIMKACEFLPEDIHFL